MTDKVKKFQDRLIADCATWPNTDKSLFHEIEESITNLSDAELLALLNVVKRMALKSEGHSAVINWYAGMMLNAFEERLKPYQEQFIDDFIEVARMHFHSDSSYLGTLYFGLSSYNLVQHIDLVATVVMSRSFEQAFNLIHAFSTMDYSQLPKRKVMNHLYLFRKYRRESGKHYLDLMYDFDTTIGILRKAVINRNKCSQ